MLTELKQSNDARDDVRELKRRLDEDGYLFFRRLLDPDHLLSLRLEMLTIMQAGGWLAKATDPMDGIANPAVHCTEGDIAYTDVYHEIYKLQSFHEIAHCRSVVDLVEQIRSCPMMPQPLKVARLWFPKFTEHTTPIHQDFVHFQGSPDNFTCWSPVGDCPGDLGGLAVLRGSHKVGRVLDHHFSLGAGNLNVDPASHVELNDEWLTTDYEIGDALIFPALTLHKALPNLTDDRLRVSLDNRYQRVGDPIAEQALMPHLSSMSPLSWEEVYESWDINELQYYWEKVDNPVVPKNTDYMDQAFDEAVALARKGDEGAKLHLRRIAAIDPSSGQGTVARTVLETVE